VTAALFQGNLRALAAQWISRCPRAISFDITCLGLYIINIYLYEMRECCRKTSDQLRGSLGVKQFFIFALGIIIEWRAMKFIAFLLENLAHAAKYAKECIQSLCGVKVDQLVFIYVFFI
jgi:hypothetical protein